MLLLVAHPLPPFGFGSRRNRQSVLLHDGIPWSILYHNLFSDSSRCATHPHLPASARPVSSAPHLETAWPPTAPAFWGCVGPQCKTPPKVSLRASGSHLWIATTDGLVPFLICPIASAWLLQSDVLSSLSLIDTGQNNPLRSAWF